MVEVRFKPVSLEIQVGVVYLSAGGEATVTFAKPFSSPPIVVALQQFATTDTSTTLSCKDVTVNGFVMKGAGNVAGDVGWIAVNIT